MNPCVEQALLDGRGQLQPLRRFLRRILRRFEALGNGVELLQREVARFAGSSSGLVETCASQPHGGLAGKGLAGATLRPLDWGSEQRGARLGVARPFAERVGSVL